MSALTNLGKRPDVSGKGSHARGVTRLEIQLHNGDFRCGDVASKLHLDLADGLRESA